MSAFIRIFSVAALLAGCASAQQKPATASDNPHSTQAKDRQGSDTPAAITNQEVNEAEKGNPDSTGNKDNARASGNASIQSRDAAERGNPDSIQNRDRDRLGAAANTGPDQMGDMDHDEMMNNATPQMMLQRLHLSNLHEIEMGKLAEQNGSERIRTYALTLQRDHQAADEKVQALAKKKNVTLFDKLKNPEMEKHMQLTRERFSSLKGAEFDSAFTTRMSMEHKKVVSMAQKWRQTCIDPDVCSLIDTLLPMLQQHAMAFPTQAAQGRAP